MRQASNSADSLVLLGEMVEMASGYADQVEQSSAHDEPFMVRPAHDQLVYFAEAPGQTRRKAHQSQQLVRIEIPPPVSRKTLGR